MWLYRFFWAFEGFVIECVHAQHYCRLLGSFFLGSDLPHLYFFISFYLFGSNIPETNVLNICLYATLVLSLLLSTFLGPYVFSVSFVKRSQDIFVIFSFPHKTFIHFNLIYCNQWIYEISFIITIFFLFKIHDWVLLIIFM